MVGALLTVSLQTSEPSGLLLLALQGYELVGGVLGVVIAALAYRGYRRNDSRPMLFVSLGFALALGAPLVLSVIYLAAPVDGWQVAVQLLNQTVEIIGLLCIIYGLRL